jgi:hypothetical protein
MVYVIQVCGQLLSRIRMKHGQLWGSRIRMFHPDTARRVSFQNKFEKLVHLVGYYKEIV